MYLQIFFVILIIFFIGFIAVENLVVEPLPAPAKHCPSYCNPFQYPNMYDPRLPCSDPFAWGTTIGTGPNDSFETFIAYYPDENDAERIYDRLKHTGYTHNYRYDYR